MTAPRSMSVLAASWLAWVICACAVGAGAAWYMAVPVVEPTTLRAAAKPPASATAVKPTVDYVERARGVSSAAFSQAWEISRLTDHQASPTPPKTQLWRVAGLTQVGSETRVLVVFEGSTAPELKKVGDTLPGGAKIVSIDATSVEVLVGGNRIFLMTGQP